MNTSLGKPTDPATNVQLLRGMAQSKEGFAICDAQGCFTYMNREHLHMFGFTQLEEVIGRSWKVLYRPEEVAEIEAVAFPALLECGTWAGYIMARRGDGTLFHEDLTLAMLPEGGIVCNCRDRTVEVELNRKLSQSERILREFSDNLPECAVIRDAQGLCSHVNRLAAQFEGGILQNAVGRNLVQIMPESLSALIQEHDSQALLSKRPVSFEVDCTLAAGPVSLHFVALPVVDAGGEVLALGLLWSDITARRRHELETAALLKRQSELLRLGGEFISLVSHEFRTPLSAIQTSNFLIKKASANHPDAKLARYLALQDQAIQTLRHLVDQVLNLNRAESLNSDQDLVQERPAQVLRELVDQANLANETTRVHLRHDLPPKTTLLVDPRLFRAAIENLVSNALKYSDPATPVSVEAQATDSRLTITVRDGGRGIPAAEQRRLFENFFRGSNVGSVAGTGLGLAIVRRAAEFHGGQVTFESQEGTGSTFRLEIPSPTRCRVLPPARLPEVRA
jgi:PAS domain S-box-containing protein